MNKKTVYAIFMAFMVFVLLVQMPLTTGWVYPDCTSDAKFEQWGPRADRLLIKLYADDTAEFLALKAGEIDICDSPLSKAEYDDMSTNYADVIKIVNYGCEYSFFMLDINNNDNPATGNPNICGGAGHANDRNPMSSVKLRRAIGHLIDREGLIADPSIGAGFGVPLYTVMPCPLLKYKLEVYGDPDMPWAWEYNPAKARWWLYGPEIGPGTYDFVQSVNLLNENETDTVIHIISGSAKYETGPDAGNPVPVCVPVTIPQGVKIHIEETYTTVEVISGTLRINPDFPVNPATGYRFWDRNCNGIEEPDECFDLIFYIRSDIPARNHIGTVLTAEMVAVQLRVNAIYATSGTTYERVMVEKDFHLYTGYYTLDRPDPDFLYDYWHSSQYWHPGACPNYNGIMDAEYDEAAEMVKYANDQEEAIYGAYLAQEIFATKAFKHPIFDWSGNKTYRYEYCGDEEPYSGKLWTGVVNVQGYGIDNYFTFLNMHPAGYAYDHGDPENPMTIRYGFSIPELPSLNPAYSSLDHEWKVLNKIYQTLLVRNASDLGEFLPWMCKSFEVGTYQHPLYGECSKVTFTMRTDISWSDGYALTVADVYYTFVELKQDLNARGLPKPWWSNVQNILDFKILDPCTFEVLLNVKSYWAVGMIGETIILPKHIWKPIAESDVPYIFGPTPDPNLIGSGPWRLAEYVPYSHVLLVANRPGRTVQTNLEDSVSITAKDGYFRTYPIYIDVHPLITYENLSAVTIIDDCIIPEIGSEWHEVKGPEIGTICTIWKLEEWDDNGNGCLDQSDWLRLSNVYGPTVEKYEHVFIAELIDDTVYIKTDWWAQKIPCLDPEHPTTVLTPVDIVVTLCNWIRADENGDQPGPDLEVNKSVYIDGVPYVEDELAILPSCKDYKEEFNVLLPKCFHLVEVKIHIKSPNWDSWGLYCTWINCTFPFWVTIKEDIAGGILTHYDGEPIHPESAKQIPTPDCKVNIRDIAYAAKGFGTNPGHPRWMTSADINNDYKIAIMDIAMIAHKYPWP